MKNLPKLFATLTLLLGLVFQGICNGSSHLSHQYGYILLQAKGGFDPALLPVIIIVLLAIVFVFEWSLSKGKKSSEQQGIPSVGDWIGRYLLTAIPVIGFFILIFWAIDGNNKLRRNWAIATIIWVVLVLISISFIFYLYYSYLMDNLRRF
jgi:hypothetical protein